MRLVALFPRLMRNEVRRRVYRAPRSRRASRLIFSLARQTHLIVMAGLVPAIHALRPTSKDVDARDVGAKQSFVASPGHDGERCDSPLCFPASGQVNRWTDRGREMRLVALLP